MNGDQPAIRIQDLTKRFGRTPAVNQLRLSVPRGTTLGLLGPNGAGKSTTLKMVMGMLRPTAGQIQVLGMDVATDASRIKQRVGYVPETHHIYGWMTVERTICFARNLYQRWDDTLCAGLLDMFQLPARRRVRELSKGMLAKLSLLIALAHEPEVLVLDEPLSGLDPIARDDFMEGVLQGLCSGDRTVVFSSHQLDEVHRLADSVAIMNAGRLLVHCPIAELTASAKRLRAVLHDGKLPNAPPENAVWQRINRREWLLTVYPYSDEVLDRLRATNPVDRIDVSDLSLDDIFKDFIRGQTLPC